MAWYDKYPQIPSAGPRGGSVGTMPSAPIPSTQDRTYDFQNAQTTQAPRVTRDPSRPFDPSGPQAEMLTGAPQHPAGLPPIDQAIQQYQASHPYSPGGNEQLFQWLQQQGYSVSRPTHAGGTQISADKIVDDASTRVLDLSTDTGWMFGQDDYWVDGKGSATPHVYTPWESNGGGGDYSNLGAFGSGVFRGLSGEDFRNTPGYQFARDEGLKAIERSAASKGTLLTGGTLKALAGYGTGLADQTYAGAWDRAYRQHQTNYSDLYDLARLGAPR